MKDAGADMVNTAQKTAASVKAIFAGTKMTGGDEKISGTKRYTSTDKDKEKSRMPEWQAELKQREVDENAYFGLSIEAEKAFWEEKLALAAKGTDEYRQVQNKINDLILKQGKEGVQSDLESLKEQTRNTKLSWEERLAAAQQIVDKMGSIYGEDSVQYKRALNDKTKVSEQQEKQIAQVALEELKGQERDTMASWAARKAAAAQATAIIAAQYGKSSVEYQKALNEEKKLAQDEAKDEIAIAAKKIQDEIKLNDDAAKNRQKTYQFQLSIGQITTQQELAAEVESENTRYAKEQELINKLKALYPEMSKSWQAAMDQMTMANQKHDEAVVADQQKAALQIKQTTDSIVSPIVNSFGNMAKQIANGTFTIQKAFQDLGNAILNVMVGALEKVATTAISKMILEKLGVTTAKTAETAATTAAETAQTAAVTAGVAERTAAVTAGTAEIAAVESAALATSVTETITANVIKAMSNAAVAATGAGEAMASIPYVGPVLAVAAAAETYAMEMGYAALASAEGGFDVPSGASPITKLHPKEMVLPAPIAETIRKITESSLSTVHSQEMMTSPPMADTAWGIDQSNLSMVNGKGMESPDLAKGVHGGMAESSGGGQTIHNHYNVQTWDSKDLRSFLKKHGNAVHDSLKGPIRNFRPAPGRV
jgi:hypothetical protein